MLVSALAVRAEGGSRRTITTISTFTVVAGLGAVLLHVVDPSVGTAVLGPFGAVTDNILAVGVRVGAGTIIALIGLVVGGGIRSTVAGSSAGKGRVAGVVVEMTVVVVPGELDESLISPGGSPGVLDQDER